MSHYENTPIQIYRKFYLQKLKIFRIKKKKKKKKEKKNADIFQISAQNIDCGYSLEPPNEYPQFMLSSTNIKKIMYIPVNPSFTI